MLVVKSLGFPASLSLSEKSEKFSTHNPKFYLPFSLCNPGSRRYSPCSCVSTANDTSSVATITITPAMTLTTAQTRVDILVESLPYLQKFHGKTIVVKYGRAAMKSKELKASVINDLVLLSSVGIRPVFVHGGGPELNLMLDRIGLKPNFLNELRVTDSSTMKIVTMVLVGKVNKHLVSLINKAGANVMGLCGMDGRLLY